MKSSIKAVGFKTITALLFLVVVFFRLSFSQALNDTSLCQILEKYNVLTMEEWDTHEGKIFCVITAQIDTESTERDTIPFQRLSFYKEKDGRLTKIHEFEEMNFLNMFHLYDGNVMTIWMSGSAAFVKIFAVDSVGKIKLVLDEGVKQMPEFAEIGRGEKAATAILLSSGSAFEKGSDFVYPESTDIFKWNGTSYELIKAVPWKTRFKALEKMQ